MKKRPTMSHKKYGDSKYVLIDNIMFFVIALGMITLGGEIGGRDGYAYGALLSIPTFIAYFAYVNRH